MVLSGIQPSDIKRSSQFLVLACLIPVFVSLPRVLSSEPEDDYRKTVKKYEQLGWIAQTKLDYFTPKLLKGVWIDGRKISLAEKSTLKTYWHLLDIEVKVSPNNEPA